MVGEKKQREKANREKRRNQGAEEGWEGTSTSELKNFITEGRAYQFWVCNQLGGGGVGQMSGGLTFHKRGVCWQVQILSLSQ